MPGPLLTTPGEGVGKGGGAASGGEKNNAVWKKTKQVEYPPPYILTHASDNRARTRGITGGQCRAAEKDAG